MPYIYQVSGQAAVQGVETIMAPIRISFCVSLEKPNRVHANEIKVTGPSGARHQINPEMVK